MDLRCFATQSKRSSCLHRITRKESPMSKPHEPPQTLADRYVAVWNETDPAARRQMIAALFAADGVHYVGTREARGYAALEQRITGSYEKNVRDRGNRFRAVPNAQALRDAVTFNW